MFVCVCVCVCVSQVYSTRPPKVAVDDLCLGVRPGERFAFLGANGAGKTDTHTHTRTHSLFLRPFVRVIAVSVCVGGEE